MLSAVVPGSDRAVRLKAREKIDFASMLKEQSYAVCRYAVEGRYVLRLFVCLFVCVSVGDMIFSLPWERNRLLLYTTSKLCDTAYESFVWL